MQELRADVDAAVQRRMASGIGAGLAASGSG